MSSANNAIPGIAEPWAELAAKLKEEPARAADSVPAQETEETAPSDDATVVETAESAPVPAEPAPASPESVSAPDEPAPAPAAPAPPTTQSAGESGDRRSISMLMRDAVVTAAEILGADLCSVAKVVEDSGLLDLEAFPAERGDDRPEPSQTHKTRIDASKSMVGYALSTTDAAVASSHAIENRFTDDWLEELKATDSLVIPLRLGSGPFGAIGIHRTKKEIFTSDDVHFAGTIGQSLMVLIVQLRVEKATREGGDTSDAPPQTASGEPPTRLRLQRARRGKDLRSSPRHEYQTPLWVAPTAGGLMPPTQGFLEVFCHDISQGGFSFYLDGPPDFETLIVELDTPGETTQLRAKVIYTRETDRNGQTRYLVGCQFTGRVYT